LQQLCGFPSPLHTKQLHVWILPYMILDLWCPSSITTINDKLEEAPPMFYQLRHKLFSGFRCDCTGLLRKVCFTILYDSSASCIASDFNTLVTYNIIQSVTLWARDCWRKWVDLN
jgi:hypothetical protein